MALLLLLLLRVRAVALQRRTHCSSSSSTHMHAIAISTPLAACFKLHHQPGLKVWAVLEAMGRPLYQGLRSMVPT